MRSVVHLRSRIRSAGLMRYSFGQVEGSVKNVSGWRHQVAVESDK